MLLKYRNNKSIRCGLKLHTITFAFEIQISFVKDVLVKCAGRCELLKK